MALSFAFYSTGKTSESTADDDNSDSSTSGRRDATKRGRMNSHDYVGANCIYLATLLPPLNCVQASDHRNT